jgi:iron complex outermembrane receptor protein
VIRVALRVAAAVIVTVAATASLFSIAASEPRGAPRAPFVLVDPDGSAVGGATVSIVGRSGSVSTARDGSFRLDPEPARPFELVVFDASGVVLGTVTVEPGSGAALTLVPRQVESVRVVSGIAPSTIAPPAAAATVLSREETDRVQPARLVDAIEEVPGADAVGSGQSAVPALRGLARGRTLILVDDARVTAERRAGPSATYLNPFALENIEIVRGPGSVAYGSDAIGGIIHARTPRPVPGDRGGRFEVAGGVGVPFGSVATELRVPLGEDHAVLLQAHGRDYDDYETPEGTEPNSSARGAGVLLRGVSELSRARLSWGVQVDRGRDLERPATDTGRRVNAYPEEDSDRVTFGVDLPGDDLWTGVELRAFVGNYRLVTARDTFATADDPRTRTSSETDAADASVRAVAGRRVAGGTARFGVDVSSRFGLRATDSIEELPDDGEPVIVSDVVTVEDASKIGAGLFVEFERPIRERGPVLSAGLRGDHVATRNEGGRFGDRSTSETAPSGYAAVRLPWTEHWEFAAQVAAGFRDPTLSDRYFAGTTARGTIVGNPELRPETSRQLDLAIRGGGGRVRIGAFAYLYRIRDLIERYEVEPDLFAFRNRGEQELLGAEIELDVVLGERLAGRATVQWARGEILDDGSPAADVPAPAATLSIDFRPNDRWWLRAATRIQARDDRPGESEAVTPGYATVDLAAGWTPGSHLEIRAVLENVLDRAYPSSSDDRAPLAAGAAASLVVSGRF